MTITLSWECCEWHDTGRTGAYTHIRRDALAAKARLTRRGECNTVDAHLIARLHLGLLDDPPVACAHCGVTDCHTQLQSALNWPEIPADRLRQSERGQIFSIAPEDDYLALCFRCHRRLDSWRTALTLKTAEGTALIQNRQETP